MAILLPEYNKIKDNFCIAYLGHNKELLLELNLLLPQIRSAFPELNIFICSNKQYNYIFDKEKLWFSADDFKNQKSNLASIYELNYSEGYHPLEFLLAESDIIIEPIRTLPKKSGRRACLTTFGTPPVESLSGTQIDEIIKYCEKQGFQVEINQKHDLVDWVIGVECYDLVSAASKGIPVTLVPTGLGKNLLSKMFRGLEIYKN